MLLLLFSVTLIFHILICKFYFKDMTSPFAIYGIMWFGLLTSTQLPIIRFIDFSIITIFIYYLSYLAFLVPTLFVGNRGTVAIVNSLNNINSNRLNKIAKYATLAYLFLVIIYYYYYIRYYGSLSYILNNSYTIRQDSIGKQIAPLVVTYSLSVGYVASGICAYLLFFYKCGKFKKIRYFTPFVLAFVQDVATASRMGIVFCAIIYFGTYLIKYSSLNAVRRKRQIKYLFCALIILAVIFLLPKYLRDLSSGGNYNIGTAYNNYTFYKGKSIVWGSFLHLYTYATGPLVAFNSFIENFNGNFTLGHAQFLPVFNILNRILDGAIGEYNLIYEFTNVPFSTNIYTYLREAYTDFGLLGTIITPTCLGLIILICHKVRFRNSYLKVVLIQYIYLYVIFSIFYTPYSQGSPAFGMVLYFIVIYLYSKKLFPQKTQNRGKSYIVNKSLMKVNY